MNQTEEVAQTNEMENGYKVDIALVIDATGSMSPVIEWLQKNAISFGEQIKKRMEKEDKPVSQLRMRLIDFADFETEQYDAIHESDFYTIPAEQAEFEQKVNQIEYDCRGGDIPENALEALWVAMMSHWVDLSGQTKGRHIIILITDAPPLNLGERNGCLGYVPEDYPESVEEMERYWQGDICRTLRLSPGNKRLILLAPEGDDGQGHSWSAVSRWENTAYLPVKSDCGGGDVDLDDVIGEILKTTLSWGED